MFNSYRYSKYMNIPVVTFAASKVLEDRLRSFGIEKNIELIQYEEVEKQVSLYSETWRKFNGNAILEQIQLLSGISFAEFEIKVWLTGMMKGAIGAPLIISSRIDTEREADFLIDILTHELIHRLMTFGIPTPIYPHPLADITKLDPKTQNNILAHVNVYAIHKAIYLDYFKNQKRLSDDKERSKNYAEYNMAWEIVERVGYKEIIALLTA
jgi:hypothetical protein